MADIPTYSGRGIGEALTKPSGERVVRAQENMLNNILEAEKFKYTETKKGQDKFLEGIDIKPEYLISAKTTIEQAEKIKAFDDKWIPIFKKYNFQPPIEVKAQFKIDRNILESWQKEKLMQMGQWKLMDEAVKKNPDIYDENKWAQASSDYSKTGDFTMTQPPWKSQSPYLYFQKNPVVGTLQPSFKSEARNGVRGTMDIKLSGTPEEAKQHIESSILSNPRLRQGVIEEFLSAPMDDLKKRVLDVNKDNVVSPEEAKNTDRNAVIEWAKEKYYRTAIKEEIGVWKKTTTGSNATTTPQSSVGGSMIKMTAGKQDFKMPKSYGATEYDKKGNITKTARTYSPKSFHFGGNTPINGVPTRNGVALTENWTEDQLASGMINANIRLYDPVKKVFLVESSSPSESVGQISRTLFEIPQENILDFSNIPIKTDISGVNTIGKYNEYWSSYATPRENTTPKKKILY